MRNIFTILILFLFSCQKESAVEYSEVQILNSQDNSIARGTNGFTTAGATLSGFTELSSTFLVVKLSGNYNLFEVFVMGTIQGSISVQLGYRKANNQTSFFHDILGTLPPYRVINGTAPIRFGEMQTFMIYRMEDETKWRTRIDDTDILEFDIGTITTGRSPLCGIGVTTSNVKTPTFNFSPALVTDGQDVRNVRVIHSQTGIGVRSTTVNEIEIGSKIVTTNLNLWQ